MLVERAPPPYYPEADVPPSKKTAVEGKSAKKTATASVVDVLIPPLRLQAIKLRIVGKSPLIQNRFSDKSRREMADRAAQKVRHKRAPKDPAAEFEAAIEYLPGSGNRKYAIKAAAFKKAAISACRYVEGIPMSYAKGAFHVLGDFIELKVKGKPKMREDSVRIGNFGNKKADLRYRPMFERLECELPIEYNASAITAQQIAHILNVAGFAIGVGEWRPEKEGAFGLFRVV